MAFQTRSGWREVAIKFTCARCKRISYLPYEKAMASEECYHLHQSKLPEGWEENGGYSRIFCADCAEAFKKFMEG